MPEIAVTRSEICPRCEAGILATMETHQDISLGGSLVRIPNVQVEKCPACGFRSLSGREVGLFEILFAPQYTQMADLISALKTAGYSSAFLREDESDSRLGFGPRSYVASLADNLRHLYLDNESAHVIEGLNAIRSGVAPIDLAGFRCSVRLPKLGEGENGIVYEYREAPDAILKIAKPRSYSREHLAAECKMTEFFARQGIPVPRIIKPDCYGSFVIKERFDGESLSQIYPTLESPENPRHQQVRSAVRAFVARLLEVFRAHPKTQTSLSPNNIFLFFSQNAWRCLLVDTGPAPLHDYSKFDFPQYWEVTIPQKIKQYRAVGYL